MPTPDELDAYRRVLLSRQAELRGDAGHLLRDGSDPVSASPTHLADAASDAQEQSFAAGRLTASSASLQEIEEALERLDAGTFGQCEACGCEIPARRLSVSPWAALCVPCRRKEESQA